MRNEEVLAAIAFAFRNLDCGASDCPFAQDRSGLRTNGGCRCFHDAPFSIRVSVANLYRSMANAGMIERARLDDYAA